MQKLALILSLLIVLVSCTVEPLETIQNRTNSEILNTNENSQIELNSNQNTNSEIFPNFMTANLNGLQYNNLRPMDYFDSSSLETNVDVYTIELSNYNYLFIQGSNTTINGAIDSQTIIINLRIPQGQWNVGTYDLQDANTVIINGNNSCVELYNIGNGFKTQSITNGSITITEFDRTNRKIRGTFSFTYYIQNNNTIEGPYELTNGTFNYQLDAPHFL